VLVYSISYFDALVLGNRGIREGYREIRVYGYKGNKGNRVFGDKELRVRIMIVLRVDILNIYY